MAHGGRWTKKKEKATFRKIKGQLKMTALLIDISSNHHRKLVGKCLESFENSNNFHFSFLSLYTSSSLKILT